MSKFTPRNTRAAKLTGAQVLEIREKRASGDYTIARLAREYQVSENTVSRICSGTSWQTIPQIQSEADKSTEQKLLEIQARESEARMGRLFGIIRPENAGEDIRRQDLTARLLREAQEARDKTPNADTLLNQLEGKDDSKG